MDQASKEELLLETVCDAAQRAVDEFGWLIVGFPLIHWDLPACHPVLAPVVVSEGAADALDRLWQGLSWPLLTASETLSKALGRPYSESELWSFGLGLSETPPTPFQLERMTQDGHLGFFEMGKRARGLLEEMQLWYEPA